VRDYCSGAYIFSQRHERGSTIDTSNLPFDEWTGVFASERLTGALLDRLTHHVHILEMNGDSYRLKQSKHPQRGARSAGQPTRGMMPKCKKAPAGSFLHSSRCIFTPARRCIFSPALTQCSQRR
jgi:hypothetical protein